MHRLHQLLGRTLAARATHVALVDTAGRSIDYEGFARTVCELAATLAQSGVEPGDRVAVYLPKHPLAAALPFAASLLGAVFVPVNPTLKALQAGHVLRDAGAVALLSAPARLAGLTAELATLPELRAVLLSEEEGAGAAAALSRLELVAWNAGAARADVATLSGAAAGDPDELAALLYTSGSTGLSKGVMITHANLLAGSRSVVEYLEIDPRDVLLAALPFSFDYGLNQLITSVEVGATCVLHDYFLPRDLLTAIERYGVTGLAGVPTLWAQVAAAAAPGASWHGLRYFTNSGGALPSRVLADLRRLFPAAAPYLMYGLTEAFRSTYLPPALVDERPGSIGRAIPGAEILVVKDDGSPAAAGEEGELVHCGPLVSRGYWQAPEVTARRFRPRPGPLPADGTPELAVWSGDIVRLDADGFLYFVGRRDGLIKTSGYRVSPDEIEEVVYAEPGVREACAFGVPDETLGQRIVLVYTASATAPATVEALVAACRQRLPAWMVPALVKCVDELPKNANGKPDRGALAHAHAAGTL
ncbi:MAG: acyl-CoA ligase (AMP-forming), exosortase A system-associated [Gammaproteobacteria bacterium]